MDRFLRVKGVTAGCLVVLAALLSTARLRPAAADTVDLQLVLAVDVSRSIDEHEYELQRKGYAGAFSDPRVLQAIKSGDTGRIAICLFEWSGEGFQQVIVDWAVIHDAESAGAVADQLLRAPRPFANRTSIGAAINYAMSLFSRSPHQGPRRVIDVSGDGANTNGIEPADARDAATSQGVTINGLAILNPQEMPWNPQHTHPPGGIEEYYRQNVAGGPGAFVMMAEDFNSFASAIVNKLIREIAENRGQDSAGPSNRQAKYPTGNVFTSHVYPPM